VKFKFGNTLLELLVALSIFAVMAVIAYSGLNTILMVRAQVDQQASQLAQLQMAFTWLANDIEQYIARPYRDEYGQTQFSLQGTYSSLELTRAGWHNPAQQPRSTLQRINYYLDRNTLWRAYFRVLDRAQNTEPIKLELLSAVTELHFRFLDDQQQWHEEWPPSREMGATIPKQPSPSPPLTLIAIEVTLNVTQWGRLPRLLRVPKMYSPLSPVPIPNTSESSEAPAADSSNSQKSPPAAP